MQLIQQKIKLLKLSITLIHNIICIRNNLIINTHTIVIPIGIETSNPKNTDNRYSIACANPKGLCGLINSVNPQRVMFIIKILCDLFSKLVSAVPRDNLPPYYYLY